jgi:hypothetical protein
MVSFTVYGLGRITTPFGFMAVDFFSKLAFFGVFVYTSSRYIYNSNNNM